MVLEGCERDSVALRGHILVFFSLAYTAAPGCPPFPLVSVMVFCPLFLAGSRTEKRVLNPCDMNTWK